MTMKPVIAGHIYAQISPHYLNCQGIQQKAPRTMCVRKPPTIEDIAFACHESMMWLILFNIFMGGLRPRKFRLSRDATERWHLLRTMVTQLIMNERITTTKAKARALKPLVFEVLKLGRQAEQKVHPNARNQLAGIVTERNAINKLITQIIPRFQSTNQQMVRIVNMEKRRLGDNAEMAYIELTGNDLEKYEKAITEEKAKFNVEEYRTKLLTEEKEFYEQKLEEHKKKMLVDSLKQDETQIKNDQYVLKFFEQKVSLVNKELWIQNKDKYAPRRYFPL